MGVIIDNGASCSVVGEDLLARVKPKKIDAPYSSIQGLSRSGAVRVLCGARVEAVVGEVTITADFAVVPSAHVPDGLLLGVDALEKLRLLEAMR